jgi:hypothetical protein
MSLDLDQSAARSADSINSTIRETGKYVGTITRAEKLLSKNSVEGLGISFKTDDGATANYLDLYTVKPGGEKLRGFNVAQAILCCTRTKSAAEGTIHFEKWDKEAGQVIEVSEAGYPSLMGKRIGLLLQKELSTNSNTGADVERVNIFGVFEADSELTASEILDKKTKPEQLEKMLQVLRQRPVRDTRQRQQAPAPASSGFDDFADDIPFN